MFTNSLLLKLVLGPIIIAAATLIARRWGERIGGVIIGLPLTSAPVSIFFAVEQGRVFAMNAAKGAMLGLIPVAVFCLGYTRAARRLPWFLSAATGIGLYLVAVWAMSYFSPGFEWIIILVALTLGAALILLGRPRQPEVIVPAPWWDIPVRVLVAAALIFSITEGAQTLGSKWSGLLSPFPIFTFVMATFSHSQAGSGAAWRFMRGVLSGLFGYLAFFIIVTLLVEHTGLPLVYSLAALAALTVNGISLAGAVLRHRPVRA